MCAKGVGACPLLQNLQVGKELYFLFHLMYSLEATEISLNIFCLSVVEMQTGINFPNRKASQSSKKSNKVGKGTGTQVLWDIGKGTGIV